MRKSFVGGNWKCNGTRRSIEILVESLNAGEKKLHGIDLVIAPTSLHIGYVQRNINPEYKIAVQNIWSSATQGAFTGELTADVVKDFGIDWVILGHSERRHKVSNEDNHFLCSKVSAAVTNNLNVIYCIGET